MALVMLAVTVSQLYKLSTAPPSPGRLTAQHLGKALSCSLIAAAIVVNVVGAARYVRQQKALVNGKIHSGFCCHFIPPSDSDG
ncbi:MAG: hypothetical protein M1830_009803 [Pleopsidium flavum]|nr:MAG: hypothetical protein M1830_009803 [Pleopsidium flavum]